MISNATNACSDQHQPRQRDPAETPPSGYYRGAEMEHQHPRTVPEPPHTDREKRKILNKIPKLETPSSAGAALPEPPRCRRVTACDAQSRGNGTAGRGRAATDVSRAAPPGPLRSPGSLPRARRNTPGSRLYQSRPFHQQKDAWLGFTCSRASQTFPSQDN